MSMPASVELHQASAHSSRTTCLVAQFDIYLRIVENAYLGFFRERNKIEEVYIDSLRKLHRKAKAIDPFFDSSVSSCTMKAAWDEVRDSLERETQVRQEFSNTLANEIICPLVALRGTQTLTRECVKKDLKESAAIHADLAKRIPRLREAYLKKCQELKDLDPPSISPSNGAMRNSILYSDISSTSDIVYPLSTRLHHHNRSSMLGAPLGGMPSTSSRTDLTRHRFNQFIDDFRGTSRGADIATRSVYAKKAVDQADKEYRGAIHQLEILRLRRITTLDYACQNLESFVSESTETAKGLLLRYFSAIVKACSAHSKLAMDAQPVVEKVSSQNDSSVFSASLHRSPALTIPRAIFYHNYHVGECPDLVFGRKLVHYATARGSENDVPKIIRTCVEEINRRGLDAEGIYMVTGQQTKVKELQSRFERSERTFSFDPQRDDVYSIASLLKLYLQELPEPLFRYPLQDCTQDSERLADDIANVSLLRSKIQRLPTIHRVSLRALVRHLSQVASNARRNKMDSKNLAAVFGLIVFGEDELPGDVPLKLRSKDSVMEILITHADSLFEESPPTRSAEPAPAPLPINTHGLTGPRTSVTSPRFEEAKAAKITPRSPRSPTTSMSSSSPTYSPITPSHSSAGSSGSHMPMQVPWFSRLTRFSTFRLHTKERSEVEQVQVPVAVARNSAVLDERGLVFLPSPGQQERR